MKKKAETLTELARMVAKDEDGIEAKIKANPVDAILEVAGGEETGRATNILIFTGLVFLGLIAVLVVIFSFLIVQGTDKEIPDALVAIGSGAAGALGALLVSPKKSGEQGE